ncbi:50S ribosomal protein L5 [candidate division WOR-1 bacterium RIFOXYA2_FULL_37_7]|uniref:Large ribosomal subunit protein uL5 n=1 Tax=candidate division WOR-1 bacterium RIFOXYB2_FULL_37_13 TaxID=1802579 RepID=A0A1F4SRX4_UNCSA|nr:MAG: 50S ribosomal protein L5 [candidate division WOR-1 bacterium RIFOXYA2_FULL_37_7]OGC23186.1 MAG: 50S ribosomal protein L5 [candidate division WOR-1 bacterium RIFOXYB2_FULL_37_13]
MKNLKEKYEKTVLKELQKEFGYKNHMEVPHVIKVVLSEGVKEGPQNEKSVDVAAAEMSNIAGQHAVIKRAKKSIANFKLKARDPIGCMVTLRGEKMYLFLNKLINISLPKVRDFRGLSPKSFDGRGNYSFGIQEQLIFPEVDYDRVDKTRGMNIAIVTSAKTDKEAKALLSGLGIPFREK